MLEFAHSRVVVFSEELKKQWDACMYGLEQRREFAMMDTGEGGHPNKHCTDIQSNRQTETHWYVISSLASQSFLDFAHRQEFQGWMYRGGGEGVTSTS